MPLTTNPGAAIEPGEECDTATRALADHLAEGGQTEAALRTYQELLAKIHTARNHPQTDLRHAHALSRVWQRLEQLQRQMGQQAQASDLQRRRLDLWRSWDQRLPGNEYVARQLAPSRYK